MSLRRLNGKIRMHVRIDATFSDDPMQQPVFADVCVPAIFGKSDTGVSDAGKFFQLWLSRGKIPDAYLFGDGVRPAAWHDAWEPNTEQLTMWGVLARIKSCLVDHGQVRQHGRFKGGTYTFTLAGPFNLKKLKFGWRGAALSCCALAGSSKHAKETVMVDQLVLSRMQRLMSALLSHDVMQHLDNGSAFMSCALRVLVEFATSGVSTSEKKLAHGRFSMVMSVCVKAVNDHLLLHAEDGVLSCLEPSVVVAAWQRLDVRLQGLNVLSTHMFMGDLIAQVLSPAIAAVRQAAQLVVDKDGGVSPMGVQLSSQRGGSASDTCSLPSDGSDVVITKAVCSAAISQQRQAPEVCVIPDSQPSCIATDDELDALLDNARACMSGFDGGVFADAGDGGMCNVLPGLLTDADLNLDCLLGSDVVAGGARQPRPAPDVCEILDSQPCCGATVDAALNAPRGGGVSGKGVSAAAGGASQPRLVPEVCEILDSQPCCGATGDDAVNAPRDGGVSGDGISAAAGACGGRLCNLQAEPASVAIVVSDSLQSNDMEAGAAGAAHMIRQ